VPDFDKQSKLMGLWSLFFDYDMFLIWRF
jgi:hypothetical protein